MLSSRSLSSRFFPRVPVLPVLLLLAGGAACIKTGHTQETPAPGVPRSPLLTSWMTQYSGRYARVVETRGGKPVTTWPHVVTDPRRPGGGSQTKPAYADVQHVRYSRDFVYVKGTGLASHQMGPWYDDIGEIFGNWPMNQNYMHRFPLHPQPAVAKVTNGMGPLGRWVNGVAFFNMLDGAHYDTATGRERMERPQPDGNASGIWVRNAVVVEQPTFDKSNAHQPPSGDYHYHDNPVALRFQRGDNVALDTGTGNYREDTSHLHHSPILGWSNDGYPIYGPYGYADPKDAKSGIRRMASGYVIRDGSHNTVDLRKAGRHSLAKWAAELHHANAQLTPEQYGPDVSARYSLGRYVEDFDFLGDLGAKQGTDFDLDKYNGRFCVTPEYPEGTYAYFVTIRRDGSPAFPYVIGRQWYGVPAGGTTRQDMEATTLYRDAGPQTAIQHHVVASGGERELQWTSVEGGHYKVEGASADGKWNTIADDVASQGLSTTRKLPANASYSDFRVTLASLDPYDATGAGNGRRGRGGPGGAGGPGGFGGPPPDGFGPGDFGPDGFGPEGSPGGPPPDGEGPGGGPGGPPPNPKLGRAAPNSAERGRTITVKFSVAAEFPPPPPDILPISASIGKIKARSVRWDGATVTAVFAIPANAALGAQSAQVVFPGPPGRDTVTFTLAKGFTVR